MQLIFTHDKSRLLEHFSKDPVLFAYHIGDLDDFYFEHCQWGAIYGMSPRIDDVLLLYTGCATPSLLAFGLTDKFATLLEEYLEVSPDKFFCHFQDRHRKILTDRFTEQSLGPHMKMKLQSFQEPKAKSSELQPVRLDENDIDDLQRLYEESYPGHYFVTRMLASGKYFGVRSEGKLVAVAGVHVDSDEYKIAVLGNICTHPSARGQGLATMVTAQLVDELVAENKTICLNVKTDNDSAIRCYESLGFEKVCEYEEALFTRK